MVNIRIAGLLIMNTLVASFMRKAAGLLALLALLLSGVVPSGWMVQAQAGSIAIIICTGDGAVSRTMALGAADEAGSEEAPDDSRSSCPFMTAAQPAMASDDQAWLPLPSGPEPPAAMLVHRRSLHPLRWGVPPSQGPPPAV